MHIGLVENLIGVVHCPNLAVVSDACVLEAAVEALPVPVPSRHVVKFSLSSAVVDGDHVVAVARAVDLRGFTIHPLPRAMLLEKYLVADVHTPYGRHAESLRGEGGEWEGRQPAVFRAAVVPTTRTDGQEWPT